MMEVIIYTRARCIHCFRARRRLRRHGAAFREIRAGRDVAAMRQELKRRYDASTFPQIVIGGQHIGGAAELVDLDRSGELARLLSEA